MEGLIRFTSLIENLRSSNKKLDKKNALLAVEDDSEVMALLKVILDPYKKFYVTDKSIEKYEAEHGLDTHGVAVSEVSSLIDFLNRLSSRKVSGGKALNMCLATIVLNEDHRGILFDIFSKDLKIGIGATDINKIWKGFVPVYDVALAEQTVKPKKPTLLEDYLHTIGEEPELWCIQQKLDGLRCIIEYDHGTITAKSRNGNEFPALKKLTDYVVTMFEHNPDAHVILDGEVCYINEDGSEDFKRAVSEVRRKSVIMESPRFIAFDMITPEDFYSKEGETGYFTRLASLRSFVTQFSKSDMVKTVNCWQYTEENYVRLMAQSKEKGWEGLMLRKDVGYEGKRTKNLLKVKVFHREEFIVDSVNIDTMRMSDPDTKMLREEEAMRSIHIKFEYGGEPGEVDVGTGWSDEQKRHYYKHPEEIIGKTVTVQFQEYSEDKDGIPSLRIPSIIKIWESGRDV